MVAHALVSILHTIVDLKIRWLAGLSGKLPMGLQGPLGAPRDFYGPLGGPGNGMGRGCNMMLSGAGLLDSIRCPTTFVFG